MIKIRELPSRIVDYKIVTEELPEAAEAEICNLIAVGYEPYGDLVLHTSAEVYVQAMIKAERQFFLENEDKQAAGEG